MRNVFVTAGAALVFGGLAFTGPAPRPSRRSPLRAPPPSSFPLGTSKTKRFGTICVRT